MKPIPLALLPLLAVALAPAAGFAQVENMGPKAATYITDEDVKRIALRDFGESQLALVLSILEEFGKQSWNRPDPRVRLAIFFRSLVSDSFSSLFCAASR